MLHIGAVVVSDRASRGDYEDRGGPAIKSYLGECVTSAHRIILRIIPDDIPLICSTLIQLVDADKCSLILTTGGTGPALRDVTPEATEAICEKMLPGFGEAMRATSLQFVPTAILSRQTAGIRQQCLIINLPGQPKAIAECLDAVFPAIPYCLDLIGGQPIETQSERWQAFRPKKSS